MFPKFGLDKGIERSGQRRVSRFREDGLRDKPVALDQIYRHVPLATVTNKVSREMTDESIINREICVFDGQFKVVVCFVEFVPEEQIRLERFISRRSMMWAACDTWDNWNSLSLRLFMML